MSVCSRANRSSSVEILLITTEYTRSLFTESTSVNYNPKTPALSAKRLNNYVGGV